MLANSLILNSNYDVLLNYNINDLYLIINEDFIEVRDNLTSTSKILYTKIYTNHSINLNIAVNNLTKQNHQLFLYPNESYPLNFQANITNINPNDSKLEISFLSEAKKSNNISYFTFYTNNSDFLKFSSIQPNLNIKVFDSNNDKLLLQILPYSQRKKFILNTNSEVDLHDIYNEKAIKSPIKTNEAMSQVIFPLNVDFSRNSKIILSVTGLYIDAYYDGEENSFDSIEFQEKTETVITIGRKNNVFYKDATIIIKPCDRRLESIDSDTISFEFEGTGNLSIQFDGWEDLNNYTNIMFKFYIKDQISVNNISSKSRFIKYRIYNQTYNETTNEPIEDVYDEIYKYPTSFVFCLQEDNCNNENFTDFDPIEESIKISDLTFISDEIEQYFDDITKSTIKNLIIVFDEKFDGVNLDLSYLISEDLERLMFISSVNIVNLNILSLPKAQAKEWAIKNCSINIKDNQCTVNELISYYSSIIPKQNLKIVHGTYFIKIDLSERNIDVVISDTTFKLDGTVYNTNDNLTLEISTEEENDFSFIFQPNGSDQKYSDISLNFVGLNENFKYIPISFHVNEKEYFDNLTIQINVSSNEHLVFNSIPKNINFIVYRKPPFDHNIQQIYVKASKLFVCYESDECCVEDIPNNQSITFVSTKDKESFEKMIQSTSDKDENYEYLRMMFIDKGEVIDFPIKNIPPKFDQLQLYGYENAQISIEDDADTSQIKSWMINHVSFARNDKADHHFKELIINNTNNVFQDPISDNIRIDKAVFYCRSGYSLSGLKNIYPIDYISYELFPEPDANDYTLSIKRSSYSANSNINDGSGNPVISPLSTNFNFTFHVPPKPNFKFYICRFETVTKDISITFEGIQENFYIQYVCKSKECEKHFTYNFEVDNVDYLQTHQGDCADVTTIINGMPALTATPLPSMTPSQSLTEHFSLSSIFTPSKTYTPSPIFSKTAKFSKSTLFTKSSLFSISSRFLMSSQFSDSSHFTNSFKFTKSSFFSRTSEFSKSSLFSKSSIFPMSLPFSPSDFSPTLPYSGSLSFTQSSLFSKSSLFTSSSIFTQSLQFSPSFPFQNDLPEIDIFIPSFDFDFYMFIITSNGFLNEDKTLINFNAYNTPFINIVFSKSNILISEFNEFSLSTILYFEAEKPGSRITIDKSLKNSEIGVKAENSPTVVLKNPENLLNIKNYKHGYSTMDIEYDNGDNKEKYIDLILREINNSNGYLTLNVEREIRSICFTSLFMARISSLRLKYKEQDENENENQQTNVDLLEEEEDDDEEGGSAQIIVNNYINISSESNAILTKVELRGNLNIYDDSLLTFKEETIFDEKSNINIFFQSSKDPRQQPILRFEGLLDSTPDKIIITFDDKTKSTKFKKFDMIEGRNFKTCLSWIDKLEFVNNKRTIETKCEYIEGGLTHFVLSTKKSKLSAGAIAGIVIGCAAAIAIIVLVIVIVVVQRKKKYDKNEPKKAKSLNSTLKLVSHNSVVQQKKIEISEQNDFQLDDSTF